MRSIFAVIITIVAVFLFPGLVFAEPQTVLLPAQTASPGSTVEFQFNIDNVELAEYTFSLNCKQPHSDFSATFAIGEVVGDRITLSPGAAAGFNLVIEVPVSAAAGEYPITVFAHRDDGHEYRTDAVLEVGGRQALEIVNRFSPIRAVSGGTFTIPVTVSNTGDVQVNDVTLDVNAPAGWSGEIWPANVGTLPPGKNVEISVVVSVPATQDSSKKQIILSARSGQVISNTVTAQIETRQRPIFLFLVLGALLAALLAFFVHVRRKGRR